MRRRDIRGSEWFEDVADHFQVDPALLVQAVPRRRVEPHDEPAPMRAARRRLQDMFMRPEGIALLERIRTDDPRKISDVERSESWKEYIFVCINAEKRAFERMPFYERVIWCVVEPILAFKPRPVVVDYGCGSSLLTRMIAQDFGDQVETVSVDVCRYAVEFSVARNRLYNARAQGLLLEDVLARLRVADADLILAHTVFEHLPDSTRQIEAVIDCLGDDGVLIENYSGHSSETPHKSDTFDAYRARDVNMDLLRRRLRLLYGVMPAKREGAYDRDRGERYWIKASRNPDFAERIRQRLREDDSVWRVTRRRIEHRLRSGALSRLLARRVAP